MQAKMALQLLLMLIKLKLCYYVHCSMRKYILALEYRFGAFGWFFG